MDTGMDDFMTRPVNPETILSTVLADHPEKKQSRALRLQSEEPQPLCLLLYPFKIIGTMPAL